MQLLLFALKVMFIDMNKTGVSELPHDIDFLFGNFDLKRINLDPFIGKELSLFVADQIN